MSSTTSLTPEEIEAERVYFEAWISRIFTYNRIERVRGKYVDLYTAVRWEAWLARAEQAKRDEEAREVGA